MCLAADVPGHMRSGQADVAAGGRRTDLSCPQSLDAMKDVLPNNNTAAMARLVPLLFVQKCHGRVGTAHVTDKRGG